jgi:disulfide bond formation protein DsbB
MKFSPRLTYLISFLIICGLLGITTYLQAHDGINPCPLCILQRLTLAVLGVLFFFGAVLCLKKCGRYFLSALCLLISSAGGALAGRQIWLQHLPTSQNVDCGASLQYMMQVLPLHEVLDKVLAGSAECSQIGWQFLNLSLAEWSLVCFTLFFIVSLGQFISAGCTKRCGTIK